MDGGTLTDASVVGFIMLVVGFFFGWKGKGVYDRRQNKRKVEQGGGR